jgi:predicted AlkP superfamily pyrophosphatase or phosphodiesterase
MKLIAKGLILIVFFCAGFQTLDKDEAKPASQHLILVSIDGFRHDYARKYNAKNILKLAEMGVQAEYMIPSFPSLTFPNHYTIVTGKYPANHGILGNSFYDRDKGTTYKIGKKEIVGDGSWYGGEPIWVLAEKNNIKSASYFWVGSEAEIKGHRPSYFYIYDGKTTHKAKLDQLQEWLAMSEDKRPRFITLYFPEVDHEGHHHGPDSDEVKAAVEEIDHTIGQIMQLMKNSGLAVNIIVTSDHGMIAVDTENPVIVEDYSNLEAFNFANSSTILMLYNDNQEAVEKAYKELKQSNDSRFAVFRKNEVPDRLNFKNEQRVGDLVLISEAPYVFSRPGWTEPNAGAHGFDHETTPEMNAIFYAWGPAFKTGMKIKPFENIHIYPVMLQILGIENTEPIDGKKAVLKKILR